MLSKSAGHLGGRRYRSLQDTSREGVIEVFGTPRVRPSSGHLEGGRPQDTSSEAVLRTPRVRPSSGHLECGHPQDTSCEAVLRRLEVRGSSGVENTARYLIAPNPLRHAPQVWILRFLNNLPASHIYISSP